MKCVECERIIYLFAESSEAEQRDVKEHMQGCAACSQLFEDVKATRTLVEEVRREGPVPSNSSLLTGRIMKALPESEPGESMLQHILSLFDLSSVRYSMALASVFLVVFFAAEVQEPDRMITIQANLPAKNAGIVLSSGSFRQDYMNHRGTRTSLLECIKPLNNKVDLQCLKEKIEKTF